MRSGSRLLLSKLVRERLAEFNMFVKLLFRQRCNIFTFKANHVYKRNLCEAVSAQSVSANYNYLLILDLEATCDTVKMNKREIIEFPCLKININSFLEEGRFHQYVRPVFQPTLSNFCVELTGILQEMVDEAKTFPEVYEMFQNWRRQENLTEENSLYITSGDWDLGYMIPEQCTLSNLEIPSHMKIWTDIKKLFGNNNEKFYNSFTDIMRYYGLEFKGRQHSGIDDCLNILQVVQKMGELGIKFKPTSRLVSNKVEKMNSFFMEEINNRPSAIVAKHFKKSR